MINTHGTADS